MPPASPAPILSCQRTPTTPTSSILTSLPSSDPTIRVVACYLGRLPRYTRLFLASAGANATVDFLVVSDSPAPPQLPRNVAWARMSRSELGARVRERLGFPVPLHNAVKLCDLKPTFGAVFEDQLKGYAYWGYCDLDVVFGDIRGGAGPYLDGGGDILSFRGPGWMSGAFALHRNITPLRRLFEEAPGYQAVLQDPATRVFDEAAGRWDGVVRPVSELAERGETVSVTDLYREAAASGTLELEMPNLIREDDPAEGPFHFLGDDKGLTDGVTGDPVLLYHMIFAKRNPFFHMPRWRRLPDRFHVTAAGVAETEPTETLPRLGLDVRRHALGLPRFAWQLGVRCVRGAARRLRRSGGA